MEQITNHEITIQTPVQETVLIIGNHKKIKKNNKTSTYVKILRLDMTHHGFKYVEGLNIDTVPFNPRGSCKSGGLYYTKLKYADEFTDYGCLLAVVTIPADAKTYADPEGNKWKADKIILSDIMLIANHPLWVYKTLLQDVKFNGLVLQRAADQTEELCLAAVRENGYALQFVKNQTEEICLAAVKRYGLALEYVKNQTEEICLAAVKENGYALQYVHDQTHDICLFAVHNNGLTLKHVRNQTPVICLKAVKQNGFALKYAHDQTEELCLTAVKNRGFALKYAHDQTEELCLAAVKQYRRSAGCIRDKKLKMSIKTGHY